MEWTAAFFCRCRGCNAPHPGRPCPAASGVQTRRLASKRGAGEARLDADELDIAAPGPDQQLLDINDAVDRFAMVEPRKTELVNLRYFVGLTFEEAAEVLGITVPTAKQWWAYARAWLRVEISRPPPQGPPA